MPQAHVNGLTIEYEILGEGPPVLLVMGLGAQLISWPDRFVEAIVERGHQVIRFDNRDIGLSSETDWEPPSQGAMMRSLVGRRPLKGVGYTIDDMAADAAGLLREIGVDRAHVVGVSMGGMIAQALTINHPALVQSLCSIMSNTGDRRHGLPKKSLMWKARKFIGPAAASANAVDQGVELFSLITGPTFDRDEARELIKHEVDRSYRPAGTARQTAAIAGSPDRTPGLRHVKAPALVIHGLVDPLVRPSGGMATSKAIPGSRLLMYPEMAHDLPPTRIDEMVDAIVANFERASVRTT